MSSRQANGFPVDCRQRTIPDVPRLVPGERQPAHPVQVHERKPRQRNRQHHVMHRDALHGISIPQEAGTTHPGVRTTDHRQRTTDNRQPTTDNRQPTTNNQQPPTNNQQPTTRYHVPVISLEPELQHLRDTLGDRATTLLVQRERREVFSLYPEIRLLAWGGAMLLATAAGIILKDNYQRIGPAGIGALVAAVAAICYVWVWRHRSDASIADDSVLLLGALLVSADAAFLESQFHWFGDHWQRQFLVVGIFHGLGAYLYRSRAVLSLSVVAVASWLGLEEQSWFHMKSNELSLRALGCFLVVMMWRKLNRREEFHTTLEHFAAQFALLVGFVRLFNDATRLEGCVITLVVAAAVIAWGFHTEGEAFVLYAIVYAVIAVDVLLVKQLDNDAGEFLVIVLSTIAAIVTLVALHTRFRRLRHES
jgi:hypothetical protein